MKLSAQIEKLCRALVRLGRNREGTEVEKLVVGLGNPGPEYEGTRHNAGWMALDSLARQLGVTGSRAIYDGLLAERGGLWLLKPLTYMNRSGCSAAAAVTAAGLDLKDLLVLVDDLNLPLGTLRLRPGGSSGGHKGLESLIEHLGGDGFPRLRIGIGPRPEDVGNYDFVLSEFAEHELPAARQMADRAAATARCWISQGIEQAMNQFNGPPLP